MKNISLVLILSVLALTGCRESYRAEREFFQASKTLKQIESQGQELAKSPDSLGPVIREFEKVAERFPSTEKAAESWFVVADLQSRQGNFPAARAALEKVVQNFTGMGTYASEARFKIAQLYEKEGNWEKAESMYWDTAEYHPWQLKGMYAPLQVVSHYNKNKEKNPTAENPAYSKAVDHFEKSLKQSGPIKLAAIMKYFLGLTHMADYQWEKAAGTWLSLTKEYPKSRYAPLSLLSAGECFWKLQDKARTFQAYDQFFAQYPAHSQAPEAAIRVGMLHQGVGEYDQARSWYERAFKHYDTKNKGRAADIRLLTAKSFQEEGKWADAERIYQEVEAKYPNSVAALQVPLMIAQHYESLGQAKEAEDALVKAIDRYQRLEHEPSKPRTAAIARRMLNAAYAQQGAWGQVMANVEEDFEKEKVPGRKGSWLFLKALIAENRLKDNKQALSDYKRFLAEYPNHPLARLAERHLESLSDVKS